MRHLRCISRTPLVADSATTDVKLTYIRNILNVGITNDFFDFTAIRDLLNQTIPLFVNKDPQNPAPGE